MTESTQTTASQDELQEMIAETETGARNPTGAFPKKVLFFVPLIWTLFQLWYASPLPFIFNIFVLNDTEARAIHLAFAIFLSFTAFPTFKKSPTKYIPVQDWALGLIGAFCSAYLYLFYAALADRPGLPTQMDLIVSVVGLILLLEATRRALGPPLMVVATVFLTYTFGGQYMPDVISHKGASLAKGCLITGWERKVFSVWPLGCRPVWSSCSCCSVRCSKLQVPVTILSAPLLPR